MVRHNGYDWHKECWEEYEVLVPTCTICNKPILDATGLDDQWHGACYLANSKTSVESPSSLQPKEIIPMTVDLVLVLLPSPIAAYF